MEVIISFVVLFIIAILADTDVRNYFMKPLAKKTANAIKPNNVFGGNDDFVKGYKAYISYGTILSNADILAFKKYIDILKKKLISVGIDPYKIKPSELSKCVYVIISKCEDLAREAKKVYFDFSYTQVSNTNSTIEIKESEKIKKKKKRTSKYISKLEQDFYLDLHNKTKNIADREIEYFIDNMDV